jgi:hypothetical protein
MTYLGLNIIIPVYLATLAKLMLEGRDIWKFIQLNVVDRNKKTKNCWFLYMNLTRYSSKTFFTFILY